jgi:outer membrane lipopolysaccharide assembly protein LptE/RlpB
MMKVQSSRFKVQGFFVILLFTVYCLLSTVLGCGYSLQNKASLPFTAIHIGKIQNTTVEPKLQDMLFRALTDEFLKHGVTVTREAGYTLDADIHHFELLILSESSDVASEYEITVKANFTLTDSSGKRKEFHNIASPFIVSFPSTGEQLNKLIASKEEASEKAMKDIAMQIVGSLLYQ